MVTVQYLEEFMVWSKRTINDSRENKRKSLRRPAPAHEAKTQEVWGPDRHAGGDGHELEKGTLVIQNFQSETHQVVENTGRVSGNGQNNPNFGTDGFLTAAQVRTPASRPILDKSAATAYRDPSQDAATARDRWRKARPGFVYQVRS